MTTLAGARSALGTALSTGGVTLSDAPGRVAPPVALIFGGGIDPSHAMRREMLATFRITAVAGRADATAMSAALGELVLKILAVVNGLAGWVVGNVSPDLERSIAGGQYLTADISVSTFVSV
jgi:hypothetical protein